MAGFTLNDTITKAVSSEMNFGQVMLLRGVLAVALIAALAFHQGAMRPFRTLQERKRKAQYGSAAARYLRLRNLR